MSRGGGGGESSEMGIGQARAGHWGKESGRYADSSCGGKGEKSSSCDRDYGENSSIIYEGKMLARRSFYLMKTQWPGMYTGVQSGIKLVLLRK